MTQTISGASESKPEIKPEIKKDNYLIPGFSNETELGFITSRGNANSSSYNARQLLKRDWSTHRLQFQGRYYTTLSGLDAQIHAENWMLSLQFEETIARALGLYTGVMLEGDLFAGYAQRYNADLGLDFMLLEDKPWSCSLSIAYRFALENQLYGRQTDLNLIRLFTELKHSAQSGIDLKATFEFLPHINDIFNFRFNSELSAQVFLSSIISLRLSYIYRYNKHPLPGVASCFDSMSTVGLVIQI